MLIMNEDTKIVIGSVVFIWVLVVCVIIAVRSQSWYDRQEELRKAELRRKKEQEAADIYLLETVEEFRHDFDDYPPAS